jgi:hypothetical protein
MKNKQLLLWIVALILTIAVIQNIENNKRTNTNPTVIEMTREK